MPKKDTKKEKEAGLLTNKTKVAVNPAMPKAEIVSKTIVVINVMGCILKEKKNASFNIRKADT